MEIPHLKLVALATLALVVASPVHAQQTTLQLDAGTSRMEFADSITATAFSISPAIHAVSSVGGFRAFGTFSHLAESWSNSGSLSGSLNVLRRGKFLGEIEGVAGGSTHSDGGQTGHMLGSARLHFIGAAGGVWTGLGIGRTWDGIWRDVRQSEVGAWLVTPSGANTFVASLTPAQVDNDIRYADATFAAQLSKGPWELSASLGTRIGDALPALPANRSTWGSGGVVYWATPSFGVVANGGTYPVDFTQGFPGGQYVSLSFRLRARNNEPALQSPNVRGNEHGTLRIRNAGGDLRVVRAYVPAATTVELYGDFTSWKPIELTSDGRGWWTTTISIPAGNHEVTLRVDRANWLVPPELIPLKDEFGGTVGLLTIRE